MKKEGHAFGSVLVGIVPFEVKVTASIVPSSGATFTLSTPFPPAAERETRVRVRSALAHAGIDLSESAVSVVVADLPTGADTTSLDLPIAVAILRAIGGPVHVSERTVFAGELALDGRVRAIRAAVCRILPGREIVLPHANANEAGLVAGNVFLARTLADVALGELPRAERVAIAPHVPYGRDELRGPTGDLFDRIANLPRVLLVGPPGSGKTMIARRLATASAPMSETRAIEVARIYSAAGLLGGSSRPSSCRPFRAPHHTVSEAGLLGLGDRPRPGEVSLAHRGVLFLDEITEFKRSTLETLAHALREKEVVFCRRDTRFVFPAKPACLVAAANPCPCGYGVDGAGNSLCHCSREARERYEVRLETIRKLFDFVRVDIPRVNLADLTGAPA